jgi:hypothetical protein
MKKVGLILFIFLIVSCGSDSIEPVTDDGPDTPASDDPGYDPGSTGDNNDSTDNDNSDSGNDNDNSDGDNTNNSSPTEATLVFPLNETECSNSDLVFEWNASTDDDGDELTYTLIIDTAPELDENPQFYEAIIETSYELDLIPSTAYYWQIESSDGKSTSLSEIWSLYTQGQGQENTAPQLQYLSPENGATIRDQSPPLQWQSSDLETADENLHYRIYFSEVGQELELIEEDTGITCLEVSGLDFGKSYQWAIYVTDEDGATNVGLVYTFTVQ